ncbi:TPA: MFS transporter, partial [Escherichia coli]|nr:MFS transporter [Escherichia coli]
NVMADEKLEKSLLTTPGVKDVLLAKLEHSVYVKIDSKITNRFEIERVINEVSY